MPYTELIKIEDLYLKREDQNITGSAKDRAILNFLKEFHLSPKEQGLVISSTGNAAISASHFCHQKNIPLTIFVSPSINPYKLAYLKKDTVIVDPQPISSSIRYSKLHNYKFLRISTESSAISGYSNISREIIETLPQTSSIFVPLGSGATLMGISEILPPHVKIFAVQPSSYCPIAKHFNKNIVPDLTHIVDSLGSKYLPLKQSVIDLLKSRGSCLVVNNSEILQVKSRFEKLGIITSLEGYMTIAGYQKLKGTPTVGSCPVIILTGTKR